MKPRHVVALSTLAALAAFALQSVRAEDKYIRTVPLDALTVPVPVIPQGSTLDLRPARAPDTTDQMNDFTRGGHDATTPGIGLSIKTTPGR